MRNSIQQLHGPSDGGRHGDHLPDAAAERLVPGEDFGAEGLRGTQSAPDVPVAVIRTTVNLQPEAVAALKEMAAGRGTTVAEIIRRAIWMEKYVYDTLKTGGKLLVQEADRTLKELVIR